MTNSEPRQGVCAWCFYWNPDPPPGWEVPGHREEVNLYDWVNFIRKEHGEERIVNWRGLGGMCRVTRDRERTTGGYGCGQYVDKHLPEPSEFADEYCGETWRDKKFYDTNRRNEKLKRQVEHHKKLAKSRLKRLNNKLTNNGKDIDVTLEKG